MTATQVGYNDAVLVVSLLYLSIDIQYEWDGFSSCRQPIHKWLLVSYALIVVSRLVYVAGSLLSTSPANSGTGGDFLLDLRQKSTTLRMLMSFTWLVIVPFFTIWSAIGTAWIFDVRRNSPQCLPSGVHLWFLLVWQVLSYLWILIHCGLGVVAWFLEKRLRGAEADLRQIEDPDLLSRWGQVSRLQGYTSLPGLAGNQHGLSAAQIQSLPQAIAGAEIADVEEECPICLHILKPGDSVRQLGSCGHTFHRSCIDLWLLRRADCPLCKRQVSGGTESKGWVV